MTAINLTQKHLATLEDGVWEDMIERGLVYRVAKGKGVFSVEYTTREGFLRKIRLGFPPEIDLPTARKKTSQILAEVVAGKDPHQEKAPSPNVEVLLRKYFRSLGDEGPGQSDRIVHDVLIHSSIGHIPVADFRLHHLDHVRVRWASTPYLVASCTDLLSRAFAYAEKVKWIDPGTHPLKPTVLRKDPTVKDLLEFYILKKVEPKVDEVELLLTRFVLSKVMGPKTAKMMVSEVTSSYVEDIREQWRGDPRYATRFVNLMGKAFTYAESLDIRESRTNPCRHLDSSSRGLRTIISSANVQEFLTYIVSPAVDTETQNAILLYLYLGLSGAETVLLRWEDVDFERKAVVYGPKDARKFVAPDAEVFNLFNRFERRSGGWVFEKEANVLIKTDLEALWFKKMEKSGLPKLAPFLLQRSLQLHRKDSGLAFVL